MAGKSIYQSDIVLNLVRGANTWVGLFSTAPTNDAGGTELAASNGYARQPIAATSGWSAISTDTDNHTRKMSNAALITFGPASADWVQATHFGVFDALSGGNLLYFDQLPVAKTVQNLDRGEIAIGALVIKED